MEIFYIIFAEKTNKTMGENLVVMKDWLKDIDMIVTRHNDKSYDVAIDMDCGWKYVKELEEDDAVQYIRKNLISIANMPDRPTGLITTGFEFIYKNGSTKFFKIWEQ